MSLLELQHKLRKKKTEKPKTVTDFNTFLLVIENEAVISNKTLDLLECHTSHSYIN